MFVEALQTYLANDSRVKALLGTARADGRNGIFPVLAPDEVPTPYLVYQQVDGEPITTSFQGSNQLVTAKWGFACYGSTYKEAKKLAKAVQDALLAMDGPMSGNAEVHGAWKKMEADNAETIPHGTLYSTHLDFEFNYYDNE